MPERPRFLRHGMIAQATIVGCWRYATRSYEPSRDNALLLRDVVDGTYYAFRVFHAGMATPVPVANGGTGSDNGCSGAQNLGITYTTAEIDTG